MDVRAQPQGRVAVPQWSWEPDDFVERMTLDAILEAIATLLDRLPEASTATERATLGRAFEAEMAGLHRDLACRLSPDEWDIEASAGASMARMLSAVADLLQVSPIGV
ncbi:MAG: hypothetical protein IT305_13815 [Chloroflexi bacterium]|nr:hypothetical protein [Chloroflexota bacterium]